MKLIIALTFFICFLQGCDTNSDKGQKQSETNQIDTSQKAVLPAADTSRLMIFRDHYNVLIGGNSIKASTETQLLDMLRGYKSSDTLYVIVMDAPSEQIEKTLKILHKLKIDNYKLEVREDYFKLPY
ncbi:MAG: hypothetical protein ACJ75B_08385 [Flavisolibacter sp.]